jgi:hypothetical protein
MMYLEEDMKRYRTIVKFGGLEGCWTVQRRSVFFWRKVAAFSIFVYGNRRAREMAEETLHALTDGSKPSSKGTDT